MIQFELLLARILAALTPLADRLGVPVDRLAHALGCMLLAIGGGIVWGAFEGFLLALSLGVLWEVLSLALRKVEPDPNDVVADAIGAVLGAGIVGLFRLLL